MEEGLTYEEKSQFDWSHGQHFGITKSIVAFANTRGGRILLKKFECEPARLDSARVTDFVNKWVAPPISSISTEIQDNGGCVIDVEPSENAPHIFIKNANYKDAAGNDRTAWHAGQVYARHSSKSEPANSDDLARCVQAHVANWLLKLGSAMESLSLDIQSDKAGVAVSIADGPSALKIGIADPNQDFPYLTKSLGQELERNQNWTAKALEKLGCKNNPIYSLELTNAKGVIMMRRYNERALEKLKKTLADDPDFDPYHD